jgi:hypothetical protein
MLDTRQECMSFGFPGNRAKNAPRTPMARLLPGDRICCASAKPLEELM